RDLGGALVAMRELADDTVGLAGEVGESKYLGDALCDGDVLRAPKPRAQPIAGGDLDADADVLGDAEFGENLGNLEGPRHAEGDALVRRQIGDVPLVEEDRAV